MSGSATYSNPPPAVPCSKPPRRRVIANHRITGNAIRSANTMQAFLTPRGQWTIERIARCAICSFDSSLIGILPLCGTSTGDACRNGMPSRHAPVSPVCYLFQANMLAHLVRSDHKTDDQQVRRHVRPLTSISRGRSIRAWPLAISTMLGIVRPTPTALRSGE